MKKLSLREALEKALPQDKPFLTIEQERRADASAILLAHKLEESNDYMHNLLKRKYN